MQVYSRFSESFRSSVPEAKFIAILDGVKRDVGNFVEARLLAEHTSENRTSFVIAAFYSRGTRRFELTLDEKHTILGAFVKPFMDQREGPGPAPDYVSKHAYSLPLGGSWNVGNGGSDPKSNLHIGNQQQWYAFDFHRLDAEGKAFKGDPARKETYYAWGQPVFAPADGTVVTTVSTVPDQEIGAMDRYFVPGNTVVIDHGQGEFSFLCHFQQHSILVKPGERVKRGHLLGKVGNSGNTTAPHLHWHLGTNADFTRAHGLPIRFASLEVNGARVDAPALKRGDHIENTPAAATKPKQ